jgi:hypothetical protein
VLVGAGDAAARDVGGSATTGDEAGAEVLVGAAVGVAPPDGDLGDSGSDGSGPLTGAPGAAGSLDGPPDVLTIADGCAGAAPSGRCAAPGPLDGRGEAAAAGECTELVGWLWLTVLGAAVVVGRETIVLARLTNSWAPSSGVVAVDGAPGLFAGKRKI